MKYFVQSATITMFFFLTHCNSSAQSLQKFQVKDKSDQKLQLTGLLPGLKEGEKVIVKKFFYPFVGDDSWKTIDTSVVVNGQFYLEHKLADGPRLFSFSFSNHNCYIVVALGNEKVTLTSERDIDDYVPPKTASSVGEFVRFDGSKTADHFLYLDNAVYRVWFWSLGGINNEIGKFKDSTYSKANLATISGLITAKASVSNAARSNMVYPFIRGLTPELFTECQGEMMRDSIWVSIYNKLDEGTKNSYNGKIMKEYLYLCMGQHAPDFDFTSADKKQMSLNQVIKNNKFTLLHFWSNGSAARKEGHKELEEAYNKYRSKGLEVVSVSFDGNENKWRKIIQQDRIPGIQTCDFKEEESPLVKLYNVDPRSTINLLIDQNGKMIAWDVDGPALFGYLYKIFGE
jgi:peroxiredoxin